MRHSRGFMTYLALLSMLGFLATDMYLPAFAQMQHDFASGSGTISASLSLFLGGFAFAQLLWGPLSDRIGRKPVLLMGLALFAVGCAGMLWVQDSNLMLLLRFIQATGVCSAAVCWQALVTDRFPPTQAAKVFATIMPLVALSPAPAPLLGAWLLEHASWRAIFLLLMVTALLLAGCTLFLRPSDVNSRQNGKQPAYIRFLRSRRYSGNVLIYGACSASFFAWLTGSPFILADIGLNSAAIGLSYVPQTVAFLIGGFGCRTLLNRMEGHLLLPRLLILFALSNLTLLTIALWLPPDLTLLLTAFCGMALANGAIYPVVVARAMRAFPEAGGKAAALQNSLQLGLCFLASLAVSSAWLPPLLLTASVMSLTIIPALAGWCWQRKEIARTDIATPPAFATMSEQSAPVTIRLKEQK